MSKLRRAASPTKKSGGTFRMIFFILYSVALVNYGHYLCNREKPFQNNMGKKSFRVRGKRAIAKGYQPSAIEQYILEHSTSFLNYTFVPKLEGEYIKSERRNVQMTDGCAIWKNSTVSGIYYDLQTYRSELDEYNRLLKKFSGAPVKDLRLHLDEGICDTLEVHPKGLKGVFKSGSLSEVDGEGFVEPMLPPMRHPGVCKAHTKWLMSMDFLVHDFAAMCRTLKRHSRTVFVDMGAALDFHDKSLDRTGVTPAVYVTHMYGKFGFKFDHIYAYEIRAKHPVDVYERIPDDLRSAYHWFNVGVASDPNSPYNPLKLIKENFNEDDFVVVKLDIDTSSVELPMAHHFLNDKKLQKLVDVLYFEHHVYFQPLFQNWGMKGTSGSLYDSLNLFTALRETGIASHSWP